MLKLTFAPGSGQFQFLYVSASALFHRGSFWDLPGIGSGVWVGKEFWIAETPEHIMAMPEMQKAMSPLVSLPPSGWTQNVINACASQHCPNWRG